MIILPEGVLSFVHEWDLRWEGGGFGLVWCFLKRPYIALLLEEYSSHLYKLCIAKQTFGNKSLPKLWWKHILKGNQPTQPIAQTILQTNRHMSSNNCLLQGGRVVFKKTIQSLAWLFLV